MIKPEDPRVDAETYCVRDVDEPDLGIRDWNPAEEATDLERRGIGHTYSEATDEIEQRLQLEEHVGETVATVMIDFDATKNEYQIDWHVDVDRPLLERVREVLPL
jgi:hypothetical protein